MRKPQVLIMCVALFFGASAFAQNSGDLRGRVHDKNGKPIVSAFVIAQDTHTAVIRAASTNALTDRKSTRLNSSHRCISYAVFCLKKKKKKKTKISKTKNNIRKT